PWTAGKVRPLNKTYGDYLPAHNWKIEIDGVVAGGMLHLHNAGVIHRDLAARNLLINSGYSGPDCAAIESRDTLKTYFETGDIPTESQFYRAINTKGTGATVRAKGCWIGLDSAGTVSNVLKTKHDTAKNAIGNIR